MMRSPEKRALPLLLLMILLLLSPLSIAQEDESYLTDLTDEDFDITLMQHSLVLVKFYAPDCEICNAFRPVYASLAATIIELNSSVLVAKVDVEAAPKLARRFEVEAHQPNLRFFLNGKEESRYASDDFSRDSVLHWAQTLVGALIRVIQTPEALQVAKARRVMMVGLFEEFDGEEHAAYEKLALYHYGIEFVKTPNATLGEELGITTVPGFAITRNYSGHGFATAIFQDKMAPKGYEPFYDRLESFLYDEKLPEYLEYGGDESMADLRSLMVSVPIGLHIYVVAPAEDLHSSGALLACVQNAGKKLRGQAMLLVNKLQPGGDLPLYDYFQIDSNSNHVQVVGVEVVKSRKYTFTAGDVTAATLVEFADSVVAGTALRIFASAPAPVDPVDPQDNVTIVVGSTFDSIVKDPTKDVVVEVYASWCPHCQAFAPIYSSLATAMQGVASLVVAKVERDENEHLDLDTVQTLPTLLFYGAEEGAEAVQINLEGSDVKSLVHSLEAHAKIKFTPPEISVHPVLTTSNNDDDDEYDDAEDQQDGEILAPPSRDEL